MSPPEEKTKQQIHRLSEHLSCQRDAILTHWREQVQRDSRLQDVSGWSRAQFFDHIPFVLDSFCQELRRWPQENSPEEKREGMEAVDDHSRHRWQQGYDLRSLVREWGLLNECLVREFNLYAAGREDVDKQVLAEAHQVWARLLNDYISENVVEYSHLSQAEAATRARELEAALSHLSALSQERGEILRGAAHDLRGGLSIVMGSASMMDQQRIPEEERDEFRRMFRKSFVSLNDMLTSLMDMARLEAGQEERAIAAFDAGGLLSDLCTSSQHLAEARGLFLRSDGPATLPVEGDAVMVRRIAQNLLLNGLKYTHHGGVTISWGEDPHSPEQWELVVLDTGPGLQDSEAAPLAHKLEQATDAAHQVEGETLKAPQGQTSDARATAAPGEGVGLSIVKRLCTLLDASIALQTTDGVGSKFRIVFPKSYETK